MDLILLDLPDSEVLALGVGEVPDFGFRVEIWDIWFQSSHSGLAKYRPGK